jgi:hypothetical protein
MVLKYYDHPDKYMDQIDIAHKLEWYPMTEKYIFSNYEEYFELPCEIKSKNDGNIPSKDQLWNKIVAEMESDDPVHLVQPNFFRGEEHSVVIAGYSNIDNEKELLVYDPWPPAPSEYSGGTKQWIPYDTLWGEEGPNMVVYLESKSDYPTVEITKPQIGLVYRNGEPWLFITNGRANVIGKCEIEVDFSENVVMSKTKYYIDDQEVDLEDWEIKNGKHIYKIEVFNEEDESASDCVPVTAVTSKAKSLQYSYRFMLFSMFSRILKI